MTSYRLFLIVLLVAWPLVIGGLLLVMSKLEDFLSRVGADTASQAGLEPATSAPSEPEVKIVFGDKVIGEPE